MDLTFQFGDNVAGDVSEPGLVPGAPSDCVGSWSGIILFKIKRFKFQHFANYSFLLMAPCLISKYAKALSDLIMLFRKTLGGGLSLPFSMLS